MKHKILGIDLDGTLLTRTKKITKKVCLALNEFMKAGGLPVLVTGRSTVSTLKYCEKIERHSKNKMKFVCCFNGAYIHDRVNNITYSNMIPDAKVRKIFSFIIDNNLSA